MDELLSSGSEAHAVLLAKEANCMFVVDVKSSKRRYGLLDRRAPTRKTLYWPEDDLAGVIEELHMRAVF